MGKVYPMYRTLRSPKRESVSNERVHVGAVEALAAVEERQLDDEARADDHSAELLDELLDPLDGAAGREHVVVDDHLRAVRDQVRVQLDRVLAVLDRAGYPDRPGRQLPRAACRHE